MEMDVFLIVFVGHFDLPDRHLSANTETEVPVFDRYVFGVQIPNLRSWPWMSRLGADDFHDQDEVLPPKT